VRKQPVPASVEDYFDDLSASQRAVLYPVADVVRDAMPAGYELGMHFGMPGWVIPLSTYPNTYNGQPLVYVSLAAQKNYHSLHLMALYASAQADAAFRAEWAQTGLKLDMGKSCLRFRSLADIDLDVIARCVAGVSVEQYLEKYESRRQPGRR
jgi:hypothetical protein